jgi:hypothetical protein
VWLRRRTVWEVEARQCEADDVKSQRWEFTHDEAALTMVNRLLTSSPGEWEGPYWRLGQLVAHSTPRSVHGEYAANSRPN